MKRMKLWSSVPDKVIILDSVYFFKFVSVELNMYVVLMLLTSLNFRVQRTTPLLTGSDLNAEISTLMIHLVINWMFHLENFIGVLMVAGADPVRFILLFVEFRLA